jgi:molybdate transport system substrate-binding protein
MHTILARIFALCTALAISFAVGAPASAAPSAQPSGEITVFAAASLTDAFTDMGERFKAANPNTNIVFNFGASTQLFTQIDQGAPADIFASADQVQMDRARAAGRIDGPAFTFAMNRLVVITPAANPGRVEELGDLARPGLRVVTSQADVPIGVYTQTMLDRMSEDPQYGTDFKDRVNANIVSREANVRQIVAKVQLGEADAAVVYKSDVTPQVASQLRMINVPNDFNVLATYPIALVQGARNRALAAAFMGYVLSPSGQEVLAAWNFVPVGEPLGPPVPEAAPAAAAS